MEQVLLRAKNAGVDRMIVTAGNMEDCRSALDLVKEKGTCSYPFDANMALYRRPIAALFTNRCAVHDSWMPPNSLHRI